MTRKQMSELIIRQLAGGDPQWSFRWGDDREISFHMDAVRDRLVWADIMQSYELGIDDSYITTYEDVPVKYSKSRKQYYFDLPAKQLALPKNRAIRQISRMKGQAASFALLPATSSPFLTGLRSLLDGRVGIKIEGQRGWFMNMQQGMDCGLLVMMIVSGADVPETQDYCPSHLEEVVKETTLKELGFGLSIQEDKANDKV